MKVVVINKETGTKSTIIASRIEESYYNIKEYLHINISQDMNIKTIKNIFANLGAPVEVFSDDGNKIKLGLNYKKLESISREITDNTSTLRVTLAEEEEEFNEDDTEVVEDNSKNSEE